MKLTSIIALNEGAYTKLAEWEAAAKKLGYTVTKDNKSGTYHAWDKTSHKGRFSAPTGKGSLTEVSVLNKKKHTNVKESPNTAAHAAGYDAFHADVAENPHPAGSDDNREWNLGWEAAQSRSAVSESFNEPIVAEGLGDAIKRSVKQVKRGMQGWGNGPSDPVKQHEPSEIKARARGYDDETVKALKHSNKTVPHSPANFQQRVLDREMKKRGLGETYTGHFNDDDWYEVDPKTNTVLRHAGGYADYRPTMLGQPIKLPNGNVLMRGMRAKDLRGVAETVAQPEYKSVKYKQYTVRQEGPKQWAIVGATINRFGTLLAAKNYIDKRL